MVPGLSRASVVRCCPVKYVRCRMVMSYHVSEIVSILCDVSEGMRESTALTYVKFI